MDEDHVDFIVCRSCERPTCNPPDNLLEFKGLCPGCVIRQEVLPNIDPRFAELIDQIMEKRDDIIMEKMLDKLTGGGSGIAIVMGTNLDGNVEQVTDAVMEAFKHIVLHDHEARAKLKEVIELVDREHKHCGHDDPIGEGGRVKKPLIRNDPRTG